MSEQLLLPFRPPPPTPPLMLWRHRDRHGVVLQHASQITDRTPHWCPRHGWAHAGRCFACERKP